MFSTCCRGPGHLQVGPGPQRAIRTPADGSGTSTCLSGPRELSAQLAEREGSGAATCHADVGAGAIHPLEACSPIRIKCERLRRALLPLGTGQLLSVHTVYRQLARRLVSYQGKH